MKKYFILSMLFSFSLIFSQAQTHDIFHFWDNDRWNNYGVQPGPSGYWHDMDFKASPKTGYGGYYWKLVIGNSSYEFSTTELKISEYPIILPYWSDPGTSAPENTEEPKNRIWMSYAFEPTYFKIYFYDENEVLDGNQTISNQSINMYNEYLYDMYHYYESDIKSFSGNVDMQTGNINLTTKILQPDMFYLSVLVNNIPYPGIQNKYLEYNTANGWEREKTINHLNEDLYIDPVWLEQNGLTGLLTIKLLLDSKVWGSNKVYSTVSSGSKTFSVNSPIPSTPTISINGGFGDNPTCTFSGGGMNVVNYILKKDYEYNSGGNTIHYVNPATSPYTDQNVVIERIGGDITANYSVKAVGPGGFESNYSNVVSKDGQSQWKKAIENEESEEIREYSLDGNYPNPFNPTTQISYQIPENSFVSLVVYNALGQEVATLVNQHQTSGQYTVQFSAAGGLPSGVYIYKLQAGASTGSSTFTKTKKMLLLQ